MPVIFRRLPFLLVALASWSCEASNAVLDVEMGLPANPLAEPMYVRVLVGRGGFPVPANAWVPKPHELTAAPSTYRFSIEDPTLACDPSLTGDCDLFIEVRFCLDRECASLRTGTPEIRGTDPQATIRYRIERPLFVGQRTQWAPVIPVVPRCADDARTCSMPEAPPEELLDVCSAEAEVEGPTWTCFVSHCDAIVCANDPGGAGGQCEGGRMGPHLCDR